MFKCLLQLHHVSLIHWIFASAVFVEVEWLKFNCRNVQAFSRISLRFEMMPFLAQTTSDSRS